MQHEDTERRGLLNFGPGGRGSRAARMSAVWLKFSFIWGPLLVAACLAAAAYPARVLKESKEATYAKIDTVEAKFERRVVRLEFRDSIATELGAARDENLRALLRIQCDQMDAREIRRLGIPCDRVGLRAP